MLTDDAPTIIRPPAPGEQLFIRVGLSSEPHSATRMELVTRGGELVAHAHWGETLRRWLVSECPDAPEPLYGGRVEMS